MSVVIAGNTAGKVTSNSASNATGTVGKAAGKEREAKQAVYRREEPSWWPSRQIWFSTVHTKGAFA